MFSNYILKPKDLFNLGNDMKSFFGIDTHKEIERILKDRKIHRFKKKIKNLGPHKLKVFLKRYPHRLEYI